MFKGMISGLMKVLLAVLTVFCVWFAWVMLFG